MLRKTGGNLSSSVPLRIKAGIFTARLKGALRPYIGPVKRKIKSFLSRG